MKSYTRDERSM
jgi:hypothetical protein